MQPVVFDEAHAYWFGELPDFLSFPDDRFPIWFGGGPEVDAEIGRRFGAAIEEAGQAEIDVAGLTLRQQAGLILVLDQFTRNVHRGSPLAYRFDDRARSYADAIARQGLDRFKLIERVFLILPFGHSESLADQERALALFAAMVEPHTPPGHRFYEVGKVQSVKYHGIISRFGRFPHRNPVLGRETTSEEAAFLATTRMEPF